MIRVRRFVSEANAPISGLILAFIGMRSKGCVTCLRWGAASTQAWLSAGFREFGFIISSDSGLTAMVEDAIHN